MIKIFSKNILIKKHAKIFPKLLSFQKKFFIKPFYERKISKIIENIFPIYSKNYFIKLNFSKIILKKPCEEYNSCYKKKETYNFLLYIELFINVLKKKSKKKFKKKFLLCKIPFMLKNFSFLINGIERVLVSQLIKSPGIYIEKKEKKISCKIIPYKGFWLEIIINKKRISFRINNKKKNNIIILLRVFGMSISEIFNAFSKTRYILIKKNKIFIDYNFFGFINKKTDKDIYNNKCEKIFKKGDILNELVKKYRTFIFLKKKYYKDIIVYEDFKNKYFSIKSNNRLNYNEVFFLNRKIATIKIFDFFGDNSNEFLLNSYFLNNFSDYNSSLMFIYYYLNPHKKYNNSKKIFLKYYKKVFRNEKNFFLSNLVRKKINRFTNNTSKSQFIEKDDIINIIKKIIKNKYITSDLDSLENKIVRISGSFLENIFEKKIKLLLINILDRISLKKKFSFKNLINNNILSSFIKEFFCVSQFSQFLDQNNNLSEITHKRRVTSLGMGGFKKGRIGNSMRDVHFSNYGKICPIETPEGKNIGLVNSFSVFSKINNNFYLEAPYLKIRNGILYNKFFYLDSYKESLFLLSGFYSLKNKINSITLCRQNNKIKYSNINSVNFIDVSSIQIFSIATLMIPFVNHNDANRALMGSNMQRQSIVGIEPNSAYICTGLEFLPSLDLGYLLYLRKGDKIIYSDCKRTILSYKKNNILLFKIYDFKKFFPSNQKNIINNKINDFISYKKKFFLLNDNSNTVSGKISLGQNLLTAFLSYDGYNFEDSIIISERISKSDLYSTLHYNEIVVELKKTKYGKETINKNVFYINKNNYNKLNKKGIAKVGFFYNSNDIILSKVRPIKILNISPEEKLINIILEKKKIKYKNLYVKLPADIEGILTKIETIKKKKFKVLDGFKNNKIKILFKKIFLNMYNKIKKNENNVKIFKKKIILKKYNKDLFYNLIIKNNRIKYIKNKLKKKVLNKYFYLGNNVYKRIKFTFLSKRNLEIGDKMSGRHGNKGVISKILPTHDMPFLKDGTIIDLILNPLGIPSRMNLGQLYEINFGLLILGIFKRLEMFIIKKSLKIIDFLKKIKLPVPRNIFDIKVYKKNLSFFSAPFEGADIKNSTKLFKFIFNKKLSKKINLNNKLFKVKVYDGRTGKEFLDYLSVGYMYFMKLHHIACEKLHARSVGLYSLITQQPLKGKSRFGGQRFGEMEVWALEAYGSAYILQELLTIKSDDIKGRENAYKNISTGKKKIPVNIPESFNILIKEINSLCLNINFR